MIRTPSTALWIALAAPAHALAQDEEPASWTGRVLEIEERRLADADAPHGFAALAPLEREGQRRRVDLGSLPALEALELREGDWIDVHGHRGRVGTDDVLLAARVEIVEAARGSGQDPSIADTIYGRVVAGRELPPAEGEQVARLELELEDGRRLTLELGPRLPRELPRLEPGDLIAVQGPRPDPDRVRVDRLWIDGRRVHVPRQHGDPRAPREGRVLLRGSVERVEPDPDGEGRVRLVLRDGWVEHLDLSHAPGRAALEAGAEVVLLGRLRDGGKRPVLVPSWLQVDGAVVPLPEPHEAASPREEGSGG